MTASPSRSPVGEPTRAVLARLKKVRACAGGWLACCPAHDDRTPSLSVTEGSDLRVVLHCHAGCDVADIARAMGLEMKDLFAPKPDDPTRSWAPPRPQASAGARPMATTPAPRPEPVPAPPEDDAGDEDASAWPVVAQYDYLDADGALVFQVQRREPHVQPVEGKRRKDFRQRQPDGRGGWLPHLRGVERRPLYRLPELLDDLAAERTVLLVEGEKDVESLRALGVPATTHAGGAKAWRPEYADVFRGARVVVLPDDDDPGRAWAEAAGRAFAAAGCAVRMLALPNAGVPGSDVTDWLAAGGTAERLEVLVGSAPGWSPGDPVPRPPEPSRFRVLTDQELEAMPPIEFLVDGMLPTNSLAAVIGQPSAGKSFVVLDLCCHVATGRQWLGRPTRTGGVLYILAEGSAGMKQRLAAWKRTHGYEGRSVGVHFITEAANLLQAPDAEHVVRAAATLPVRPALVIIDTLHRSMPGGEENSAKDVGVVIANADRIRRATGACVLLVHHDTKEGTSPRGSGALPGAVDTMIRVLDDDGRRLLTCEKQKDAPPFEPVAVTLDPVEGTASCVVRLAAGTWMDEPAPPTPQQLTQAQRQALLTLSHDFLEDGASAAQWEEAFRGTRRTFYRAKKALVSGGYVLAPEGTRQGGKFTVSRSGREVLASPTPATPTGGARVPTGANGTSGTSGTGPGSPLAPTPPGPEGAMGVGGQAPAARPGPNGRPPRETDLFTSGRDRALGRDVDDVP